MTEKLYECAACFIVLGESNVDEVTVEWHNGTSDKTVRVCKERAACNARRHERHLAALGAPTTTIPVLGR